MQSVTVQTCFPLAPWQLHNVLTDPQYLKQRFENIAGLQCLNVGTQGEQSRFMPVEQQPTFYTTLLVSLEPQQLDKLPKMFRKLVPETFEASFCESWMSETKGQWSVQVSGLPISASGTFLLEAVPSQPWTPPQLDPEVEKLMGRRGLGQTQSVGEQTGSIYDTPPVSNGEFKYEAHIDEMEPVKFADFANLDGDMPLAEEELQKLAQQERRTGLWAKFHPVPEYPFTIKHVSGAINVKVPLASGLEKKAAAQATQLGEIELVSVLEYLMRG